MFRKLRELIAAFPFCLWQRDGVKGVDYDVKPTWHFCRQQQASKEPCPVQCQVCAEDQEALRKRGEGMAPR